jgi:Ca2+-binding RTX toxin-like protein
MIHRAATAFRITLATGAVLALLAPSASAAVQPGDIVLADSEASNGTGALIRVDPTSGQQSVISDNSISGLDLFVDPYAVTLGPSGGLLVADREAFDGTGGVIRVDPDTGQQTLISDNAISPPGFFADPDGIAVSASGDIFVADASALGGTGGVIRVDPTTGKQTIVSDNAISELDLFNDPRGIIVERGGDLAIADYSSPPGGDDTGAIVGVDLDTGQQNLISNNVLSGADLFEDPFGLAAEATGNLLVANAGQAAATNGVMRVSRSSGQQSALSVGGSFSSPEAIAVDAFGRANIADREAFGGDGGVIRVDPDTGAQTAVSSNLLSPPGSFVDPVGIFIVPPICMGQYATIVGTEGTDTLVGSSQPDVIVTQGGNDIADGRAGPDLVCGGPGRNRLVGGDGKDRFAGGSGPDVILGNGGADLVNGEAGADKIDGGSGRDKVFGNVGRDKLVGGKAADKLYGNSGRDKLAGGKGNDLLSGGFGPDKLTGGRGHDRLRGGPGKDLKKQ